MTKNDIQQELHNIVFDRFVRMPYGHLLDYADKNGETIFPTKQECVEGYPNVLGWMTSIENGAFFGGLYLYALVDRCEYSFSDELLNDIVTITKGLFLLCDVGKVDGFIARGVATDGVSHYPFSSEDQVGPWVVGLWKLYQSPICPEEMKPEIRSRLIRTLKGVLNADFSIPTEWEGVTRGSYNHSDWRGCAKCIFFAYLMDFFSITNGLYSKMLLHHPDGSIFNRLEIVSHGFSPDMVKNTGLIQFWIDVCANICIYELSFIDSQNASFFDKCLYNNATTALKFVDDYHDYENDPIEPFNTNWRMLSKLEWSTPDEAVSAGGKHCGEWIRINPRRRQEHGILANSLFAMWIAISSKNKTIFDKAYCSLLDCAKVIHWDKVVHSYAFVAESALCVAERIVQGMSNQTSR